jgi:hypothetical protein
MSLQFSEYARLVDPELTVHLFISALSQYRSPNRREFGVLSEMLANTWWYNVNTDIHPTTGFIHHVHLIGFTRTWEIVDSLYQQSDLVHSFNIPSENPILNESTVYDFKPTTDDNGGASIIYNNKHKCYMHLECLTNSSVAIWFCRLHSHGFRLLDTKTCDNMLQKWAKAL